MPSDTMLSRLPRTQAVQRALRAAPPPGAAADLLCLETWKIDAPRDLATMLRVRQIVRANPDLAAEIDAELAAG